MLFLLQGLFISRFFFLSEESKGLKPSGSLPVLPILLKDEVPVLFREPHVEAGFRALDYPWYYYICSIFQFHNESMNVWTHMLAAILMLRKLLLFRHEVDFLGDPYTWPLLAGLVCGTLLYSFSSFAHCMQSKSEMYHYTSFMLDYAGIGLYGLGSVIVHLAYCSEPEFFQAVEHWFVPAGALLGFAIYACCTIAKTWYKRPYPFIRKVWQMAPVGSIYILLISPIVHRLFACFYYEEDCNESIPYHMQQIVWFMASGFFFASDVPQKYFPGKCDIFFHSHQIFHICIMMCTLVQMDGVLIDLQTRQDVLRLRPVPTFWSAFGPVIVTLLAEAACIYIASKWVKHNLVEKKDL